MYAELTPHAGTETENAGTLGKGDWLLEEHAIYRYLLKLTSISMIWGHFMEGPYQDLHFEVYVGFQKIENEGLKGERGLGKLITWREWQIPRYGTSLVV